MTITRQPTCGYPWCPIAHTQHEHQAALPTASQRTHKTCIGCGDRTVTRVDGIAIHGKCYDRRVFIEPIADWPRRVEQFREAHAGDKPRTQERAA